MEIRNLDGESLEELHKKVTKLQEKNPDIIARTFMGEKNREVTMADLDGVIEELKAIKDLVYDLSLKVQQIFGGHVLINGKWEHVDTLTGGSNEKEVHKRNNR